MRIKKIIISLLLISLSSCTTSVSSGLTWRSMGSLDVIYAPGLQVNKPTSADWETAAEYHQGKKIKQLIFREVVPGGSDHTAIAHVRAIGPRRGVVNAHALAAEMKRSFNLTRGLSNSSQNIEVGRNCAYDCVRFEFSGNRTGSKADKDQKFAFHGNGYWYLHPTQDAIFEVFFSERFPAEASRRYDNSTLRKFLKSLRFVS